MTLGEPAARVSGERRPPSPRRLLTRRIVVVLAMAATVTVAGVAWFRLATGPRRAVEELPPAERRGLYERTLETLRASCQGKRDEGGLADYCHRQAEFIVLFPECDEPCHAAAEPFRDRPTR